MNTYIYSVSCVLYSWWWFAKNRWSSSSSSSSSPPRHILNSKSRFSQKKNRRFLSSTNNQQPPTTNNINNHHHQQPTTNNQNNSRNLNPPDYQLISAPLRIHVNGIFPYNINNQQSQQFVKGSSSWFGCLRSFTTWWPYTVEASALWDDFFFGAAERSSGDHCTRLVVELFGTPPSKRTWH